MNEIELRRAWLRTDKNPCNKCNAHTDDEICGNRSDCDDWQKSCLNLDVFVSAMLKKKEEYPCELNDFTWNCSRSSPIDCIKCRFNLEAPHD